MNLENIRCFLSLAECLNFTKAAEKEHVTQTSMSRRIGSLEQELGVPLFYRDNRQVELTGAGKEFYVQSQRLIEMYEHSVNTVRNVHSGFVQELKIGVGVYEHKLLSPFLSEYASKNPPVRISCMQFRYRNLLEQFQKGLLDVILSSDQFFDSLSGDNTVMRLICDEDWKIGVHRDNPVASLAAVSPEDLKGQLLITMNEGSISQIIAGYRQIFAIRDAAYVNSYETKVMMINANLGVGLFPSFVTLLHYTDIRLRPFSFPYKPRRFYILCRKDNPSRYVHEFVESYCRFIKTGSL